MDEVAALRKRSLLRQFGERLTGDSSLRDALTDEQANRLVGWGLAQIEREAERILHLPAETAEPVLEVCTNRVRTVMYRANQLFAELSTSSDSADSRDAVWQLVAALGALPSPAEDVLVLEATLLREWPDENAVFETLMLILGRDEEE